jgi:HEAT repeats
MSAHVNYDLVACFAQDVSALLESFSEREKAQKQSLQQMLIADPLTFSLASVMALAKGEVSPGSRYLVHLLRKENLLMPVLIDPAASRTEDAMAVVRLLAASGSPMQSEIEHVLETALQQHPSDANVRRLHRVLDLLDADSRSRFFLFQAELMSHPDGSVRARAVLLIGRSNKNVGWLGRWLLDRDARVRANAVEALWSVEGTAARPLLEASVQSDHNRVAANAAVGLYRIGDPAGVRVLFDMLRHENPAFRTSAIWGMGETGDPRFLPVLEELFHQRTGKERNTVLRALARLRRRQIALRDAEDLEIHTVEAVVLPRDERHLVFTLRSPQLRDLSHLTTTEFAIWEGGALVTDYTLAARPNPALMIAGFVLPRFSSTADPYRIAILEAIGRCLRHKRQEDLWRIDRYLVDGQKSDTTAPLEHATIPYDEAILGPHKALRGFLNSPELLAKLIESPGPRERTAAGLYSAFDRQGEAVIKFSGERKMFVFLHPGSGDDLASSGDLERITAFVQNEHLTVHGFALADAPDCDVFRDACRSAPDGTYRRIALDQLANEVERTYLRSLNCFEATYLRPSGGAAGGGRIEVFSPHGRASAEFFPTPLHTPRPSARPEL